MDRNKYFDKCYSLLISELFVKSNQDLTAPTERKVKQILQKINNQQIAKISIWKAVFNKIVT